MTAIDNPKGAGSCKIHLLGRFRVVVDGRAVQDRDWPRRKARQLLQLLALAPNHRLHRDQVMEFLWPDSKLRSATNNLDKTVHMLRRVLEPALTSGSGSRFLSRRDEQLALEAESLWIDAEALEQQARRALGGGDAELHESALDLYTGDLLGEELYEEWAAGKREQLRLLFHDLLSSLARIHEREGRTRHGIDCLNRLLDEEPSNEAAQRRLMRLYARIGHRQQALQQFQRCREALRRDLDAEPEERTVRLYREIADGSIRFEEDSGLDGPAPTEVDSLAVLPFENTTRDPGLEFLSEGITESLIMSLSHLPRLRVMARSTVFRYKGRPLDPRRIGEELKVRAIVLGRVSGWNHRLRVAAELVDTADGSLLWGERYDRVSTDIFAVQEEISGEISAKLRVRLSGAERARLQKRHTQDTEAYLHYLKGRFHWNKRTARGLRTAVECFRQATEADPAYALAYSGLADCYNLLSLYSLVPPRESMPKAKAAALKALEIDSGLAEAHTSLAYVRLYYDWDWPGAEESFLRALQLNPNYPTAHHWYHELLVAMGRFDEESRQVRRARELDPLSLIITTEVGWGLYFARQYDRAARHLRNALEMDNHFPVAHFILGLVRLQQHQFDRAAADLRRALRLYEGGPFPLAVGALGAALAGAGEAQGARQQLSRLDELSRKHYVSAYAKAIVHAGLGDADAALESLEEALRQRDDRSIFLNVDPLFDPLRKRGRFRRIIREIGLEPIQEH